MEQSFRHGAYAGPLRRAKAGVEHARVRMRQDIETEVAIVGGGPVGLTLAIDLAWRGVPVAVAERREAGEPPSVKCNHISSRSMEIYRRLGVADAIRAGGLPDDFPHDVVYRTRVTGKEMSRIHIPGRSTRFTDRSGPDGWWPTPEPPHRINQIFFEPILFAHAVRQPGLSLLNRTEVVSFVQHADGVVAQARDLDTGEGFSIRCRYLVGCDGGRSGVRKQIGARLHGDAVIQRVQSSYIRAPGLLDRIQGRPGWFNYSYNRERPGSCIAIDGRETWLIHSYLFPHEEGFESVDRDANLRAILGVDEDFAYEVLAKEDWVGRRLVADRFRQDRVFICGDASHVWVPYAGYGMNAGIADAMNLSWLLAGVLKGWGEARLLDAYEAERLPITDQVSRFAMRHAERAISERNNLPECVEDDTPEGEAARAAVGEAARALNVQQYCCAGLNYGYFYDGSPLIAYDGEPAPAYTMSEYAPSTAPGCRTPHFWLADGRSLYDALGPDYTLLRFDPSADATGLVESAQRQGLPLSLLEVEAAEIPPVYRHGLVISRPDQHVAWRGDAVPADPDALVALLRGAGPALAAARAPVRTEAAIDESILA